MKLTIREDSANYVCSVINLPVKQAIEGLDNLVQVEVFGNTCLISKDSDPNILYLFFPAGCQLSEEFLYANNLFRDTQLNADNGVKGFFEPNGRVKGLKLKGIVSNGFVIPIISLTEEQFTGLKKGDEFTDIHDITICKKYIAPSAMNASSVSTKDRNKINRAVEDLLIPTQFRFHDETSHLSKNLHDINPNDIIVITDKWHGSSCILSKVYINSKLNLWQHFLNLLGAQIQPKQYGYVYSSGKPKSNLPKGILRLDEKEKYKNKNGDYYSADIWKCAFDDFKHTLEDGISLYGELVGYSQIGQAIQKGYDYGCVAFSKQGTVIKGDGTTLQTPSQYKFIIYKITYTKPDGSFIKFSWQQLKDYCAKYSLEHVKEFYFGKASDYFAVKKYAEHGRWDEDFLYTLQKDFNLEQNCKECKNKVPAEGIVVSIDCKKSYKLKSKLFTLAESNSEEVDTEANQ